MIIFCDEYEYHIVVIIILLLDILITVVFIIIGIGLLLVTQSIIIDKKSKSVIFKSDSTIEGLKSARKICFSDIKKIELYYYTYVPLDETDNNCDNWEISLITFQGKRELVFKTDECESAEEIAGKISKIIGEEISLKNLNSEWMGDGPW